MRMGLYGHTHYTEINLVRAMSDLRKNIGFNFIGGSVTPLEDINPSFTVIEFDEEFMIPVDVQVYFFNLTKANEVDQPDWELLYNLKEEYNLRDLSPDSLNHLANQIREDEAVANKYDLNKSRKLVGNIHCN